MLHFALRHDEPAPRFDRLLLLAEQTGPAFLRHLERVTGARAYVASYGSSETGTLAVTCENGQMHLQTQSYVAELLDENGNTAIVGEHGGRGELVVTTLDLPARPLVRYRTGDLVEIDPTRCECGLTPPVLRTLGRAQDVVAMADGGVRQDEFEAALWAEGMPQPAVLSYMLVFRGTEIVCLATTDRPAADGWSDAVSARLGPLFTGRNLAVQEVDALPPLASLGSYVGWKLSRVLDLGDPRMWDRLPAPIFDVVKRTLTDIEAKTGLRPLAA
jgi:phenylacetate-CoA ligase